MNEHESKKQKPALIFIAEDVPRNLHILVSILKKENYRIAAAGNGRRALEMIPEVNPDLILLDVMMPEMDGFDVCKRLKMNPATKEIPVIFLTAKAENEDLLKGFECGAVDYITKPFNGAELLSRIRTHLELKFSRETLKELIATKDKFLSIIAHDLSNPLQCILLYSDSLFSDFEYLEDEMKKDYALKCYNTTLQLSTLLNNLLEWARAQMGRMEFLPEPLTLHSLILENVALLKENAGTKNIKMFCDIDPNLMVFADKNMIRTVIRNLMGNAIKFTHENGTVRIDAHVKDNMVFIRVSDTGVGIAPEDIDGLFRIDVAKTSLGTAQERGTGLGLILCKDFIERNNGTISVTSVRNEGSSFTFSLPEYFKNNFG